MLLMSNAPVPVNVAPATISIVPLEKVIVPAPLMLPLMEAAVVPVSRTRASPPAALHDPLEVPAKR